MLYTATREHADHALCEKDAYTRLSPLARCRFLADRYDRAYDYEAEIKFGAAVPQKDGHHELVISTAHGDVLRAIELPHAAPAIELPHAAPSGIKSALLFIKNEDCSRGELAVSGKDQGIPVQVPVSVHGIPMVALQHASLHLRVESPLDPRIAVCTIRVLPTHASLKAAQVGHRISSFAYRDADGVEAARVGHDMETFYRGTRGPRNSPAVRICMGKVSYVNAAKDGGRGCAVM